MEDDTSKADGEHRVDNSDSSTLDPARTTKRPSDSDETSPNAKRARTAVERSTDDPLPSTPAPPAPTRDKRVRIVTAHAKRDRIVAERESPGRSPSPVCSHPEPDRRSSTPTPAVLNNMDASPPPMHPARDVSLPLPPVHNEPSLPPSLHETTSVSLPPVPGVVSPTDAAPSSHEATTANESFSIHTATIEQLEQMLGLDDNHRALPLAERSYRLDLLITHRLVAFNQQLTQLSRSSQQFISHVDHLDTSLDAIVQTFQSVTYQPLRRAPYNPGASSNPGGEE